jgi:hypothetical protein
MTSAPYLGPEPTIAQLRKQFGWMWAYCGIACSHRSALPLGIIAQLLGGDAPASALRRRLRCSRCGRRTASLSAPSVVDHGLAPLPLYMVPEHLRREIACDALRSIGGEVPGPAIRERL